MTKTIPRAPMASIFEGQPLKTRPFLSKTRVIFGFEDVNDLPTYLNPQTRSSPPTKKCVFMTRSIHNLKQCLFQMTAAKPRKFRIRGFGSLGKSFVVQTYEYTLELPPAQDASHHQDYDPFLVGKSRTKPSFATVSGWRVDSSIQ